MKNAAEILALLEQMPGAEFSQESLTALYSMAYHLYRNGKYADAKQFFRFLSLIDCQDRRYWMGLGACQQMLKDYRAAIESYSVAALQEPNDPLVHLYAADCFRSQGDQEKSLKTLESAMAAAKSSDTHQTLSDKLTLMHAAWSAGGCHD